MRVYSLLVLDNDDCLVDVIGVYVSHQQALKERHKQEQQSRKLCLDFHYRVMETELRDID